MGCAECSVKDEQESEGVPAGNLVESLPATGGEAAVEPEVEEEEDEEVADWVRLGGAELEEALRGEWVQLVRADWLLQHAETGGVVARRQEMPPEAYISLEELRHAGAGCCVDAVSAQQDEWLRVLVVSHPWLQPEHPDPHGENLRLLAKALRIFLKDHDNESKPYGVFMDFTALFQAPREEEEEEIFQQALPTLSMFYSHPATVVLKITQFPAGYPDNPERRYILPEGANTADYDERGWCFAESSMSNLVKASDKILALRHDDTSLFMYSLWALVDACKAGRRPPLHPGRFEEELGSKTFRNLEEDFDRVNALYADAFERRMTSVTELDYSSLFWDAGAVQTLVHSLRSNSSLQKLNLQSNRIGARGAVDLAEMVKKSELLSTLDLAHNKIGLEGTTALAGVLGSHPSLQSMDLRENQMGEQGAVALGAALESNQSLQTLNLSGNEIGALGAVGLGKALACNRSLQTLQLEKNYVGDEGAAAIAQRLEANCALQALRLNGNHIGAQGAVALGRALETNRSLQALLLRANNVGDEGAVALGKGLKENRALQTLHLGRNHVGEDGGVALAKGIEVNQSLQTLFLYNNQIGDKGAIAFLKTLKKNSVLCSLHLADNNISRRAKDALGEAVQERSVELQL